MGEQECQFLEGYARSPGGAQGLIPTVHQGSSWEEPVGLNSGFWLAVCKLCMSCL